jgi:hypothetical protein
MISRPNVIVPLVLQEVHSLYTSSEEPPLFKFQQLLGHPPIRSPRS